MRRRGIMTIDAILPISSGVGASLLRITQNPVSQISFGVVDNVNSDADILFSVGQQTDLSLIASIAGGSSLLGQIDNYALTGVLKNQAMGVVSGIGGNNTPILALGDNSLNGGMESLTEVMNPIPEIPSPPEPRKENNVQEIVIPRTITGYSPNESSEDLLSETALLMEETRALLGDNVDVMA